MCSVRNAPIIYEWHDVKVSYLGEKGGGWSYMAPAIAITRSTYAGAGVFRLRKRQSVCELELTVVDVFR
jgi:hypothetical protein